MGKLALIDRLVERRFYSSRHIIGRGISIYTKLFTVNEEEIILQMWLNHYQSGLKVWAKNNLKGTHGLMLAYDITNNKSFENLEMWLKTYRANTDIGEHKMATVLLGCKVDLEENRAVTKQEAREFAHKHDISVFLECSARTGLNIEESFMALISEIERVKEEFKEIMDGKILERDHDVIYNYREYMKGEKINRKEEAYFKTIKKKEVQKILEVDYE